MDAYERHVRAADKAMARAHDQLAKAKGCAKTREEERALNVIANELTDSACWLMRLAAHRSEARHITAPGGASWQPTPLQA